jgi:gamma-glutamylcyclotransferase
MFYFAYGSNLWRQQMEARCPDHREIGQGMVKGWSWIITTRGYASIVPSEPDYVLGTVYHLSDTDVENLDVYEGVAEGGYFKEMMTVSVEGSELSCLVYVDYVMEEGEPKEEYIGRINNGIRDALFPEYYVERYLRPFIPL